MVLLPLGGQRGHSSPPALAGTRSGQVAQGRLGFRMTVECGQETVIGPLLMAGGLQDTPVPDRKIARLFLIVRAA